jgi:hypothetical protein
MAVATRVIVVRIRSMVSTPHVCVVGNVLSRILFWIESRPLSSKYDFASSQEGLLPHLFTSTTSRAGLCREMTRYGRV